ncbi:hypothetical protein [Rhizobium sp. LEGMi135b]
MSKSEELMALISAGKIEEARALLEQEKARAKFEPDTVKTGKSGEAIFYKGRRRVEQGPSGDWQLAPKK